MTSIVKTFSAIVPATLKTPARTVKVFIANTIISPKDKTILKYLVNSGVDIMSLKDMGEAKEVYLNLIAEKKLNRTTENVNIRYNRWYPSKESNGSKEDNVVVNAPFVEDENQVSMNSCDNIPIEASQGALESVSNTQVSNDAEGYCDPVAVYNSALVAAIADKVVEWGRTRIFQSFISWNMMKKFVTQSVYGNETIYDNLSEYGKSIVDYIQDRFTSRFCVICPFNDKGYNMGYELMLKMHPEGVRYRLQQYNGGNQAITSYFIIYKDKMVDCKTKKEFALKPGTLNKRTANGFKIDSMLYFSSAVVRR